MNHASIPGILESKAQNLVAEPDPVGEAYEVWHDERVTPLEAGAH